jgi:NAD(P)-dependent dehydrogenase (short-subunit alcohol dehydrogenase family)
MWVFMDKVWLVTGSASGLGRNIAEAVLESGDRLVATAGDTKRLDDLVKKYGARVRAVPLDVTGESAAQAAVQTAVAAFGRLDVVVNNAGYGDIAPLELLSAERFKAVMDTNFYGVLPSPPRPYRSCASKGADFVQAPDARRQVRAPRRSWQSVSSCKFA